MAGNITIIEPSSKYQKVAKGIILDKRIDAATLGIYVKVLALGKEWKLNITGLASYLEISEGRVRKAFALLEDLGYLRRLRVKNEAGRFVGWDYEIGVEPFPVEAPATDIQENRHSEIPTSEKTDIRKNRHSENCNVGANVNELLNNNNNNILIKTEKEIKTEFNFKSELLALGVEPSTADQWLEVRRKKGAVNTELALRDFAAEVQKSGMTAEQCVQRAVIENWRGFKAAWLLPKQPGNPTPNPRPYESAYTHNARVLAAMFGTDPDTQL